MRKTAHIFVLLLSLAGLGATPPANQNVFEAYGRFGADVALVQKDKTAEDSLKTLETLLARYRGGNKASLSDPLERAFYGALASMRCQYESDTGKRMSYLQDAFPALDSAVAEVNAKGNDTKKMIVHRVRSDVYLQLPDMLKKRKIALNDATIAWELAQKSGLHADQQVAWLETYARALKKSGRNKEIADLVAAFKKKNQADLSPAKLESLSRLTL